MHVQDFLAIIDDPENKAVVKEYDAEIRLVHRRRSIAIFSGLFFFGFAVFAILGFLFRDRSILVAIPLLIIAAGCHGISFCLALAHVKLGKQIDHEFITSFQKWSERIETMFKSVIDERNKTVNPRVDDIAQYFISFKKNIFATA